MLKHVQDVKRYCMPPRMIEIYISLYMNKYTYNSHKLSYIATKRYCLNSIRAQA